MKTPSCLSLLRAAVLVTFLLGSIGAAKPAPPLVSVNSKTMNGYVRAVRPDNTYQEETYVFADGGRLNGNVNDPSIDHLKFAQVAGVVAASLKRQNYVATTDAKTAQLLIFVSWGTTVGQDEIAYGESMTALSSDFNSMTHPIDMGPGANGSNGIDYQLMMNEAAASAMDGTLNRVAFSNQIRDERNRYNADILGYDVEMRDARFLRPFSVNARDVMAEVEESRYFVVLKAYDFQRLRNHQGKKLLWETRYSIRRHGNRFDEQLVDMTRFAGQFYGQSLRKLIRRPLKEGRVEVGTPTVVPASDEK